MAHIVNPAAEAILDQEFPCLNHGFVRMIDFMGGDQRVVQSARVSYGAGTKSVRQDRGLIHYLWKSGHTSPFEQVQLSFHCKMPIFVARQWVRHRTARLNEISGRYSVMKDEFYVPLVEDVCYQNKDNKQGRSGPMDIDQAEAFIKQAVEDQGLVYSHYASWLDEDDTKSMARELARMNLPLSLYTEWYWQMDLHNLLHFLGLRIDGHAQKEIRVYAEAIAEIVKAVAPVSYEAFEEYSLNAVTFSATEMRVIRELLNYQEGGRGFDGYYEMKDVALVERLGDDKKADEFVKKLAVR